MFSFVDNVPFFRGLRRFLDSNYFPVALAAVVLAVNIAGFDVAGLIGIALLVSVVCLFASDMRPLIPVLFFAQFVLSVKDNAMSVLDYFKRPLVLYTSVAVCAVAVAALVARTIASRKSLCRIPSKGLLLGFVVWSVALLLGGVFSRYWTPDSLLLSLSLIVLQLGLYAFLFASMGEHEDNIAYVARTCALSLCIIIAELIYLYACKYVPGTSLDSDWKLEIVLGWGISNVIGELTVFLMVPVFYLVYRSRRGWAYYLLIVATMVAVYFTLGRNALLVGAVMFVAGTVLCAFSGKNKLPVRIMALVGVLGVAAVIVVGATTSHFNDLSAFFRQTLLSDRGRFDLWRKHFELFLRYPAFGVGFSSGGALADAKMRLAHDTIVQLLSGVGAVGTLAYLFHRVQTVALFLKKPTVGRTVLGLAIIAYLCMGLLDPITFYANFSIYYTVMLVVSEKDKNAAAARAVAPYRAEGKGGAGCRSRE